MVCIIEVKEITTTKPGFIIPNQYLLPVGEEELLISNEKGLLYLHEQWTEVITVEAEALCVLISGKGIEKTQR